LKDIRVAASMILIQSEMHQGDYSKIDHISQVKTPTLGKIKIIPKEKLNLRISAFGPIRYAPVLGSRPKAKHIWVERYG
jgi:hypothetical protein